MRHINVCSFISLVGGGFVTDSFMKITLCFSHQLSECYFTVSTAITLWFFSYFFAPKDVTDLFGTDLPIEGGKGGEFAWRDGPFLSALKAGHWIVLDEVSRFLAFTISHRVWHCSKI